LPLRPNSYYAKPASTYRLKVEVTSIDTAARNVVVTGSGKIPYDRLLLATGAEPVRLRSRAPTSRMSIRCARWGLPGIHRFRRAARAAPS